VRKIKLFSGMVALFIAISLLGVLFCECPDWIVTSDRETDETERIVELENEVEFSARAQRLPVFYCLEIFSYSNWFISAKTTSWFIHQAATQTSLAALSDRAPPLLS